MGRRRKIEVPTDTQPQFQLADTAEDIEIRRREKEERDERDTIEQEERDRERREENQERGGKRVQTDMDTGVESTYSRQKKGQMKSIFLSDSDEEAIAEFVKQHEELYDKTNNSFKDKQKKEGLWEQLAASRNLPVKTVKKWFDMQRTRYGKLTQTKSGQAAEKSTEHQTWLKDSFSFLPGHIRRKGVSKSSAFKSPQRPSAATASEISIASDVTHQPSSTSPKRQQPPVTTATTSADPVLEQFQQMRSMISTFQCHACSIKLFAFASPSSFCYLLSSGLGMALVKFESPSTWIISGITGSGKTTWLYKLLTHKNSMFEEPPWRVMYCYSVWTKLFDDMEKNFNVEFVQGMLTSEKLKDIFDGKHHLVCLNDLQCEVANSKEAEKLLTQLSHHNNLSVIYLNQNFYFQGKCACTLNLNTTYTVLLKNPRNIQQVALLGRQLGMGKLLKEAYCDATSLLFGYLVMDLSPKGNESYRLRTNVFPDELPMVIYQ